MPGHPLAKRGAPHGPPYRPSDAPPGPLATASLTGHLLAPYWPSGEASHWPKGRPRLAPTGQKGRGGDAFARPSPRLATYAPPPADRGLRTGGLPTPRLTHWPKGGVLATYAHPLATPALPHSPDFRGAVAKGRGRGF